MPCRVSDCRFSQTETSAFNAMWDSDQFCGKQLEALVDARLEIFGCASAVERHHALSWATFLGNHWSHFKPCVLCFRNGVTEHCFTFVLGLQSPVVGGLVQLESDELLSGIDTAIDLHSGESTSSTSLMGLEVGLEPVVRLPSTNRSANFETSVKHLKTQNGGRPKRCKRAPRSAHK